MKHANLRTTKLALSNWIKTFSLFEDLSPITQGTKNEVKKRILLIGSLPEPPLTGGIAVGIQMLLESNLKEKYEFLLLNRAKRYERKKSITFLFTRQLIMMIKLVKYLIIYEPAIVHVKTSSYLNFFVNCFYILISRCLLGRKTILQVHGGEFDLWYKNSPVITKCLIRAGLRIPCKVFVLSLYWKKFLIQMIPERRVTVVPNGVKAADFRRVATPGLPPHERCVKIIFVGSPDNEDNRRKGLYDVLRAIPVVQEQANIVFLLAGFRCESFTGREVSRICGLNGVKEQVQLLGLISGNEKVDLLLESDIFLLPSYGENMPNTLLEAMAASLPVIATNVGAISQIIEENVNGFLIEPGDYRKLSERIIQLVRLPNLRKLMGENNRRKIECSYDFEIISKMIDKEYCELIGA